MGTSGVAFLKSAQKMQDNDGKVTSGGGLQVLALGPHLINSGSPEGEEQRVQEYLKNRNLQART